MIVFFHEKIYYFINLDDWYFKGIFIRWKKINELLEILNYMKNLINDVTRNILCFCRKRIYHTNPLVYACNMHITNSIPRVKQKDMELLELWKLYYGL